MNKDTLFALLMVGLLFLLMGFAGTADYEAQLVLDEPLTVMVADGAR